MKISALLLVGLLVACGDSTSQTAKTQPGKSEQGVAYFYDFLIERITGLHEDEIERYGRKHCIDRAEFEKILKFSQSGPVDEQYNRLDVRAKVVFSDRSYFIDRFGVVSTGHGYLSVDTEEFSKVVARPDACAKLTPQKLGTQ